MSGGFKDCERWGLHAAGAQWTFTGNCSAEAFATGGLHCRVQGGRGGDAVCSILTARRRPAASAAATSQASDSPDSGGSRLDASCVWDHLTPRGETSPTE